MNTSRLVEHFFRHEYRRLVAVLARRVGEQQLDAVEDAVQSALMSALNSWTVHGVPDNPTAWLFRVAHNALLGDLRQQARRDRLLEQVAMDDVSPFELNAEPFSLTDVHDDLLRMLFVCCDEAVPAESQLVLALKMLCGFDVGEIAIRLHVSEANVYKRLSRARNQLRKAPPRTDWLSVNQYAARRSAVHTILYLLFTEGHLSSHATLPIRRELCDEAIRLTTLLARHQAGEDSETFALLALMHLHAARTSARIDVSGGLLLLEEQDRALWDQQQIAEGLECLAHSAQGDLLSRYHLEAGIAAEHCLAQTFAATRWQQVAVYYERLELLAPSPLVTLNRAVAVAEWQGPQAALAILHDIEPPSWLAGSYMWSAVLADLHGRCGQWQRADRYRQLACAAAPTAAVKQLLARRLIWNANGAEVPETTAS